MIDKRNIYVNSSRWQDHCCIFKTNHSSTLCTLASSQINTFICCVPHCGISNNPMQLIIVALSKIDANRGKSPGKQWHTPPLTLITLDLGVYNFMGGGRCVTHPHNNRTIVFTVVQCIVLVAPIGSHPYCFVCLGCAGLQLCVWLKLRWWNNNSTCIVSATKYCKLL